jgi:hypothetical protein
MHCDAQREGGSIVVIVKSGARACRTPGSARADRNARNRYWLSTTARSLRCRSNGIFRGLRLAGVGFGLRTLAMLSTVRDCAGDARDGGGGALQQAHKFRPKPVAAVCGYGMQSTKMRQHRRDSESNGLDRSNQCAQSVRAAFSQHSVSCSELQFDRGRRRRQHEQRSRGLRPRSRGRAPSDGHVIRAFRARGARAVYARPTDTAIACHLGIRRDGRVWPRR